MELVKQIAQELRERGNKTIKSLFWNQSRGNLSVFYKSGKAINYPAEGVLDADLTVKEICDNIE
jgi:hypothetical protein